VVDTVGKVAISDLGAMNQRGERITMVTAYDYPMAQLVDRSGIDVILVGDSLGMVVLGFKNPIPVTVDDIVHHCKAVARRAENPMIVADLPFMSYHVSEEDAIRNSGRLIKEGGADAVKLEGGRQVAGKVKAIVDTGIPVMGHIGLMPQRASVGGRFKAQGKDAESARGIVEDALALEAAGAFSIVLEFVAAEVAEIITEKLRIPTIGIGSGPSCDGQVLVLHDILGFYEKSPPFAKRYANLREEILRALQSFRGEVQKGVFPAEEHYVRMDLDESEKMKRS
jgi:3-methyl-2-oxobutanoate hydroxymethyltransferase